VASPITVPGFVGHLAGMMGRLRAYEQMNSRQMANQFALSGQGNIYPGADYDFARGGVNLGNINPDLRQALISIIQSGHGWIRG